MSTASDDAWVIAQARRHVAELQQATISGIEAASAVDAIRIHKLIEALRPFVAAYQRHADPIGDSDLYDEQPRSVFVLLGDCRKAASVFREIAP